MITRLEHSFFRILIPYLIFSLVIEKNSSESDGAFKKKGATSKMHLPHSAYWPCDLKFSQLLKTSLATKAVYSKFSIQISRFASLFSIFVALKYVRLFPWSLFVSQSRYPKTHSGFKELLISYFPSIAHCKQWLTKGKRRWRSFLEHFQNHSRRQK